MGNCLDGLRNSSQGSPRRLEEGSTTGKRRGKESESVLLKSDYDVLGDSLIDKCENNKQPGQNNDAQVEEDHKNSLPTLDASLKESNTGQSYHPSPNSTVVRRLFNSPQKCSVKSPYLSNNTSTKDSSDTLSSLNKTNAPTATAAQANHATSVEGGAVAGAAEVVVAKVGGATVDINRCNEHQLIVVGFSKNEARAVINYRISHGRFHRTTHVKTVPGLSEKTWQKVKSRITLVPSSALHLKLSRSQRSNATLEKAREENSIKFQDCEDEVIVLDDDINDEVEILEDRKRPTVELNYANIHQLCCVGIAKPLAQEIINYRVAKRGFKSIDEIKNVPGMSQSKFAEISPQLTLTPRVFSTPRKKSRSSSLMPSPISKPCYSPCKNMFVEFGIDDNNSPKRPWSNSVSRNGTSCDITPSSECISPRQPAATPSADLPRSPASTARKGNKSIRIATWNLQCFSNKRVGNVAVLEVVCTTIVKHGFDIIAVQEIGSKGEPLQFVCNELNEPTTSGVKALGSSRKKWQCCISPQYTGRMFEGYEYNGFLWNEQSGIHLTEAFLLHNFKESFVRMPFAGKFTVKDWSFVLISLHLRAEGGWGKNHIEELQNEVGNLPLIVTSMEALMADVILLGDFNMEPSAPCFESLKSIGFFNVFNSDEPTNISAANPDGSKCYDNIWISEELMNQRYKGNVRNIVRRNLQHPNISDSKSPGKPGTVSDHCPVWAGFTT